VRHLTGLSKWVHLLRALSKGDGGGLNLKLLCHVINGLRHEKPTVLDGKTYLGMGYPPLGSRAHRTATAGLQRVRRGERPLMIVNFAVTARCTMDCVYCSARNFRPGPDLSTERLIELAHEAQDLGCYKVNLTGGEPCLRDDLPEIAAELDDRSYVMLLSSGAGFPRMARRLRDAGVAAASFSLDSFDEATQNRRRGNNHALEIAVRAAKTAVALGFYTGLQMFPDDAPTLSAMTDYVNAAARLGVHKVLLLAPRPCVALGRDAGACLSPKTLDFLRRCQGHFNRMRHVPAVMSTDDTERPETHGCTGGFMQVYVHAQGDVTPCPFYPIAFGNVNEMSLADAFNRMLRYHPLPGPECNLVEVFGLIRDVPDDALPVKDPAVIDRVYEQLHARPRPLPRFWRCLGLANGRPSCDV